MTAHTIFRPPDRTLADLGSASHLFAPLARAASEIAAFAYCDAAFRLVGCRHMGSRARDWTQIDVRTVVADALAFDARIVVMAHNHPSGIARVSESDIATTRLLVRALRPIEVTLADHLILAGGAVTSLRASGML